MSRDYDYHKPHRSHVYHKSRRKWLIFAMLGVGAMIIALLFYLDLTK